MSDMGLPDPTGLNEAMAPAIEEIRDEAHDIIGRGADAVYDTIMGPEGDHYRIGAENVGRLGREYFEFHRDTYKKALDFIGPFTWLDEWLLGTKEEREQDKRKDSKSFYESDGGDLAEQGNRTAIKEIHFAGMSKQSAFIKFINWLIGHGISQVEREGAPLGASFTIQDKAGVPQTRLLDLAGVESRNEVLMFIADNWDSIPQVKQRIEGELQKAFDVMASANPDDSWDWEDRGWDKPYYAEDFQAGRDTMAQILRTFGSLGNEEVNIANMNQMWGHNAFEHLVAQNFENALIAAQEELLGNNRAILIGPSVGTLGEGLMAEQTGLLEDGQTQAPQDQIAFITSFDGTPFGDIQSVKDLFSGGKIGPMDASYFMDRLYNETKDGSGYSSILARIQQELYAWGYMSAPAEWGKLEIPGLVRGEQGANVDPSIDALQMLQADLINEGLRQADGDIANLSPDGTAYLDKVVHASVARKLETLPERGGREGQYVSAIESVISGLDSLASRSGRTFTEEGKDIVRKELKKDIKELTLEEQEEAFGGGGTPEQQMVAEVAMRLFYQDEDWEDNVFIGANDSAFDYYRYAKRSGALSDEELEAIENSPAWDPGTSTMPMYQAGLNPGQLQNVPEVTTQDRGTIYNMDVVYDDFVDPRPVTRKAARDVIISFFLDLIKQQGEETAIGEVGSLANALNNFGNTLGSRVGADFNYTIRDYERMAQEIREAIVLEDVETPELYGTLQERIARANQLTGINPQPFGQLASVISRRRDLTSMPAGRNV